jgi:tRNA(adenine34) deaminase
MRQALEEAATALALGEVPVGAIVVRGSEVIARAHNLTETSRDPTAHAEMLAIREAAKVTRMWRLDGTALYVTLEPCPMCAGAIVEARIPVVVFGAADPRAGAAGSVVNILESDALNHRPEVIRGVLGEECGEILKRFFRARRRTE